jgi:hypothetical protein
MKVGRNLKREKKHLQPEMRDKLKNGDPFVVPCVLSWGNAHDEVNIYQPRSLDNGSGWPGFVLLIILKHGDVIKAYPKHRRKR